MILPLLVLLFVAAAASKRSPLAIQGIIVDVPDVKLPPPDGFRSGAGPDPSHPNDPNRGRYFGEWTQSREEGSSTLHTATLVQVASDASGELVVQVWLTAVGDPQRCTRWTGAVRIRDGRIQPGMFSFPVACGNVPTGAAGVYGDDETCIVYIGGRELTGPSPGDGVPTWEQRGPDVGFLLETEVRDNDSDWTSADCERDVTWYVDALWHYKPIPTSSGVERG